MKKNILMLVTKNESNHMNSIVFKKFENETELENIVNEYQYLTTFEYSNIQCLKDDLYNNVFIKLTSTQKTELFVLLDNLTDSNTIEYSLTSKTETPIKKIIATYATGNKYSLDLVTTDKLNEIASSTYMHYVCDNINDLLNDRANNLEEIWLLDIKIDYICSFANDNNLMSYEECKELSREIWYKKFGGYVTEQKKENSITIKENREKASKEEVEKNRLRMLETTNKYIESCRIYNEHCKNCMNRKYESNTEIFEDLKSGVEKFYRVYISNERTEQNEREFTKKLYDLCYVLALAVVKKCKDPRGKKNIEELEKIANSDSIYTDNSGHSDKINNIKNSIIHDTRSLLQLATLDKECFIYYYDKDGNKKRKIKDQDFKNKFDKLSSDTLGDGLDLVNQAVVKLIEEIKKEEIDINHDGYIEQLYDKKKLRFDVSVNRKDISNLYKYEETNPIRETFRAIRQLVANDKTLKINGSKFVYIDDIKSDSGIEDTEVIYHRSGLCSNMFGTTINKYEVGSIYNSIESSGCIVDYEELLEVVENMDLTTKQRTILKYRLNDNISIYEIAKKMHITEFCVRDHLNRIAKKFVDMNILTDMKVKRMLNNEKTAKQIENKNRNDMRYSELGLTDRQTRILILMDNEKSVQEIAGLLGVSHQAISKSIKKINEKLSSYEEIRIAKFIESEKKRIEEEILEKEEIEKKRIEREQKNNRVVISDEQRVNYTMIGDRIRKYNKPIKKEKTEKEVLISDLDYAIKITQHKISCLGNTNKKISLAVGTEVSLKNELYKLEREKMYNELFL